MNTELELIKLRAAISTFTYNLELFIPTAGHATKTILTAIIESDQYKDLKK